MKRKGLYILIISVLLFGMIIIIRKGTYSSSEDTLVFSGTRKDLQNFVVSTALSYYYNNNYSDYEQKTMTDSGYGYFNWRNFNNTPEDVSRSNLYDIDCSSFGSITYLYSLGFDCSEYFLEENKPANYTPANYTYYVYDFMNSSVKKTFQQVNSSDSLKQYQKSYFNLGVTQGSSFRKYVEEYVACHTFNNCDNTDTTSDRVNTDTTNEFVYYYKVNNKEVKHGIEYTCVSSSTSNDISVDEITDGEDIDENTIQDTTELTPIECNTHFEYTVDTRVNCNENIYNESCDEQIAIRNEVKSKLQPGDLLIFRRRIINGLKTNEEGELVADYNTTGHVMVYVGGAIKEGDFGFIHATGKDFGNGTNGLGYDVYSVRYDNWESKAMKEIFANDGTKETTSFFIFRPINKFCDENDNCTITDTDIKSLKFKENISLNFGNTIARSELVNLRLEQYEFKDSAEKNASLSKDLLNKYNSVNVGDKINYRIMALNESKIEYCSSGSFGKNSCVAQEQKDKGYYLIKWDDYCLDSSYSDETSCQSNGATWIKGTHRDLYKYSNFVITAKIPDGTKYVDGSCNYSVHRSGGIVQRTGNDVCTYNEENKTITWNVKNSNDSIFSIDPERTAYTTWNYQVEVVDENINKVVNEGMVIESVDITKVDAQGDAIGESEKLSKPLHFGKMVTSVNQTINGETKITSFQNAVKEVIARGETYEENFSGLRFVQDVYNSYLGNSLPELENYSGLVKAIYIAASEVKSNLKGYFRRMDYAAMTDKQKSINKMLVPGLYGGRHLRNNVMGDRPGIVYKDSNMSTLEVGDVIICLSSDGNYDAKNRNAWLFYGYDSSHKPVFIQMKSNKYLVYGNGTTDINDDPVLSELVQSSKSGVQIFREIYKYDLFFILRPTRKDANPSKGDVNKDNMIDWHDATSLAKYVVNESLSQTQEETQEVLSLGDMNNDENIKMNDVIMLLKRILNGT